MNIEQERSLYEELQTIELQISSRIQRNPELVEGETSTVFNNQYKKRNFKQILLQQHEITKLKNEYKRRKVIVDELNKNSGVILEEMETLKDPVADLKKFDEMYQKIKKIDNVEIVKNLNDYYKMKSTKDTILSEFGNGINFSKIFSPQEYFGKYLDLIEIHEIWINLNNEKLNYIKFLEIFHDFTKQNIIEENNRFLDYLKKLFNYLVGFIRRSIPLYQIDKFIKDLENEFNTACGNSNNNDPLYCQACDKTFAKQTVFDGHLTGKKHLKNIKSSPFKNSKNQIELLKYQINQIVLKILNSKRQSTKLNNERKTALTERERQIEIDNYLKEEQEQDNDISDDDDDHDEENGKQNSESIDFKNPMNLPLGPDGQPIPFWLWKLHGLGIEFNCEICGNFIYKGRRSFDNHFGDKKHIYGLKCLGIDSKNATLFKGITEINQVLKLWHTIQKNEESKLLDKEESIEVEDDKGNVMSEKLYNELKKQGLV